MAGTVPEFGPMSRLCPGLPDFAALSRNPARLHKWGCGTSINSVYYQLLFRISRYLVGVVVHDRSKVGVVSQKWAWPDFSRSLCAHYILYPRLSSHKFGNYAANSSASMVATALAAMGSPLTSYCCKSSWGSSTDGHTIKLGSSPINTQVCKPVVATCMDIITRRPTCQVPAVPVLSLVSSTGVAIQIS
jgi:hypothetical protein